MTGGLLYARMGLLFAGIALFVYALNSGQGWARIAGIVCVVLALVTRFAERLGRRR